MPKIKALLCDIDGTLVDSNWLHAAAWQDAFAAMDIHLELEDLRRQIGKGGNELIPVFVPWWKRGAIKEPLKALRKFIFQTEYMHQVKTLPRVRDFLLEARNRGLHLALSTSADKEDLETYKKLANIEDLIEVATSADDAERAKPHPDIFAATLDRLGIDANEAIALGDTPYDAEAAGKAGILTIGVTTGGWTERELLDAGCIEAYKDVADLLDRFDQSILANKDYGG